MNASEQHAGGQPRPDFFARFQSAVPILVVYFGLAALYAWQASRRPVPTIFTDELELTQLARAIAETGEPARRGVPYEGFASLVAYVLAPVWWLGSATASWAAAKLILVLAMTATVFPAYGLARMVVPKWYALAAAGASVAVPALAYSPFLVEEPLAYPVSTLALWLIARSLERPSKGRIAAAFGMCVVAVLTRTQLAILFVVLVLGLALARVAVGGRAPLAGASGRRWDWVGAVTIALGVAFALTAAIGHASEAWRNTMLLFKDRIFEHASWALGALAIGVGVLPGPARRRGARAAEIGGARPAHARLRHDQRRRARRLRHVRGDQGRLQLDGLLDARRRAKPHLPLPDPVHLDGARVRSRRRPVVGGRGRDDPHALGDHDRPAPARPVPVLRGARARDRDVLQSRAGLVRGRDPGRAHRRLRRVARSSSSR